MRLSEFHQQNLIEAAWRDKLKTLWAKFKERKAKFLKAFRKEVKETKELLKILDRLGTKNPPTEMEIAFIREQVGDIFKGLIIGATAIVPIPGMLMLWPAIAKAINIVFHTNIDWLPTSFRQGAVVDILATMLNAIIKETERQLKLMKPPTDEEPYESYEVS